VANRFQLWGQAGWASAEVVGETHYAKAIRALFGNDFNPQGTDITVPVQLIPDRSNRHDRNAVGVWADNALLGHLPRPEAARYVGVLTALTKRNLIPEVNAQIHGREWGEYDGRPPAFVGTIRLDLAEPHMLVPANEPPVHEHRLLPTGSALQVNGQEAHLDALAPFQRPEGECWAYVTLHEMADHLVEVRLGDARVGDLSPKTSFELTPVLRYQAERGLVVAARAVVKSNVNKTEVLLHVIRVQDLPESWTGPAARSAAGGRVAPVSPPPATTPVVPAATPPVVPAATTPVVPAGAGPDLPAAGTSAVPSWMRGGDAVPSWAATPSDAQPTWMDRSELVPTWVQPSGPVPSWAASVSGPVPTIAGRPQPDDPATGSASGAFAGSPAGPGSAPTSGVPVPGVAAHPIPGVPATPLPGSVSGVPASPAPTAGSAPPGLFGTPTFDSSQAAAGSFGSAGSFTGAGSFTSADSFGGAGSSTGSFATGSFNSGSSNSGSTLDGPGSSTGSFAANPLDGPGSFSATGSPAVPFDAAGPASGSSAGPASGSFAGAGPASGSFSGAGSPSGSFTRVGSSSSGSDGAGSPPGLFGGAGEIAETTVLPALSAVLLNKHANTVTGSAPVSPAPEPNRHPAIPPAPTGIKFVVPPGWPTPPDGWYPPEGWRPDAAWPLAPAGWQWWVPTWE
jgi:hypothetical protein